MDDVQELIKDAREYYSPLYHKLADALEALNNRNDELETRLDAVADTLEAAEAVIARYSGWWDGSPEDSWRLERDMRAALGMPEYSEEEGNW